MWQRERTPELTERQGAASVRAVALVLPGGSMNSRGRHLKIVEWGLRSLMAQIADQGAEDGIAVHLLRYRYRGWNGGEAHTAVDTQWALGEIQQRYGEVPVALIGNSLGGRAAFWTAGHPSVVSVTGVAPWLPAGDAAEQLAGRKVLIMHGDGDRSQATPEQSLAYAERARRITPDVCRFEVAGANHYLLNRAPDCWALATDFVLATIGSRPLNPVIVQAMSVAAGLRMPLPVGFGRRMVAAG
jgi:pimeloyl-ACP methyl ester carboxylesterase